MPNTLSPDAFVTLEKTLLAAIEQIQKELESILRTIASEDEVEISPSMVAEIKRIFIKAQNGLTAMIKKHRGSTLLPNFYEDAKQLVTEVNNMEAMLLTLLTSHQPVDLTSHQPVDSDEDELLLLGVEKQNSNQEAPPLKAFFHSLSKQDQSNYRRNRNNLIAQIECINKISIRLDNATNRLMSTKSDAIFFERFFDARREVADAIEKIHYVIHPRSKAVAHEERPREFGLLTLCKKMQKQTENLLKEIEKTQKKRIEMLKGLAALGGKMSISPSSSEASSSSESNDASDDSNREASSSSESNDASDDSSLSDESSDSASSSSNASRSSSTSTSSGFFSRSPSPTNPQNQQQGHHQAMRRQRG
jgi:hypothetical protein